MNKTQFKNNFNKYFTQVINNKVISIETNRIDAFKINYEKNNKNSLLYITSNIQMSQEGILNFDFNLKKDDLRSSSMSKILNNVNFINDISLYIAKDAFCKEQALEFNYNDNSYFYILIYTDMVESSLEIFEKKLEADKFKKVAF